jgi:hypothetical protein
VNQEQDSVANIIRLANSLYGPKEYGKLADEAGRTKAEYVASGGDPADVSSPERIAALANGGPMELLAMKSLHRDDGTIAAPFVPTPLALATNIIEPAAKPVVQAAMRSGIKTVSSGTDTKTGKGFAIGKNRAGQIVKISDTK